MTNEHHLTDRTTLSLQGLPSLRLRHSLRRIQQLQMSLFAYMALTARDGAPRPAITASSSPLPLSATRALPPGLIDHLLRAAPKPYHPTSLETNHQRRASWAGNAAELPSILVGVTSLNRAASLAMTVASILDQDYPTSRFRILVVDDASTDTAVAETLVSLQVSQVVEGPVPCDRGEAHVH